MAIATLLEKESDVLETELAMVYQQQFAAVATKMGREAPAALPECESSLEHAEKLFVLVLFIKVDVDEADFDSLSVLAWRDTFTLDAAHAIQVVTGAFLEAGLGNAVKLTAECTGIGNLDR